MAASTTAAWIDTRYEDALAQLPASKTMEYGKGQVIYGPQHPSSNIYLVVTGNVAISHIAEDGGEVLLEVVRPDELFGESALFDVLRRSDRATALEQVCVMTWPVSAMEELVTKRPRLAVALMQILAQRNAEYACRIETFAFDGVERRLARSLIRFSERLGTVEENGSVCMRPFTHEMLARYVGTSREIVTQFMNRFRKDGYVEYSRQGIRLYRDALRAKFGGGGLLSADRNGQKSYALAIGMPAGK